MNGSTFEARNKRVLPMKLEDYVAGNRKPPTLDEVLARVNEISSLPHVAMKVMEVANDPDSSVIEMKSAIEMDPSLSAGPALRELLGLRVAGEGLQRAKGDQLPRAATDQEPGPHGQRGGVVQQGRNHRIVPAPRVVAAPGGGRDLRG